MYPLPLSITRIMFFGLLALAVAACGGGSTGGGDGSDNSTDNGDGNGNGSSAVAATPGDLTLVADEGQITASWSKVDDATGYTLYYKESADFSDSEAQGVKSQAESDGATTSAVISGLTNNLVHYVRVTATNAAGESELSAAQTATPQSGQTSACDDPTPPSCSKLSFTQATNSRYAHYVSFSYKLVTPDGDDLSTSHSRQFKFGVLPRAATAPSDAASMPGTSQTLRVKDSERHSLVFQQGTTTTAALSADTDYTLWAVPIDDSAEPASLNFSTEAAPSCPNPHNDLTATRLGSPFRDSDNIYLDPNTSLVYIPIAACDSLLAYVVKKDAEDYCNAQNFDCFEPNHYLYDGFGDTVASPHIGYFGGSGASKYLAIGRSSIENKYVDRVSSVAGGVIRTRAMFHARKVAGDDLKLTDSTLHPWTP